MVWRSISSKIGADRAGVGHSLARPEHRAGAADVAGGASQALFDLRTVSLLRDRAHGTLAGDRGVDRLGTRTGGTACATELARDPDMQLWLDGWLQDAAMAMAEAPHAGVSP